MYGSWVRIPAGSQKNASTKVGAFLCPLGSNPRVRSVGGSGKCRGMAGLSQSQRDHKRNHSKMSGFFVPAGFERRVGMGSIQRRFRHEFGPCGTEPLPAGSLLGTSLEKIDLSHFFCLVTCCYSDK